MEGEKRISPTISEATDAGPRLSAAIERFSRWERGTVEQAYRRLFLAFGACAVILRRLIPKVLQNSVAEALQKRFKLCHCEASGR
jgi:hypothetical protein